MIHGCSEAVHIGTGIDGMAGTQLFRRGVVRSSQYGVFLCQGHADGIGIPFGDAEVSELYYSLLGDHDIGGFDIAVDDTDTAGGDQSGSYAFGDFKDLFFGKRSFFEHFFNG